MSEKKSQEREQLNRTGIERIEKQILASDFQAGGHKCRKKRERGGWWERKWEEQLIKASSFNNADVITCTGPHTCLAPHHINIGVVERERAKEVKKLETENAEDLH